MKISKIAARNADLGGLMVNYIWNFSDLKNIPKNGFKVFSCFSCGGGSTMGYKLAGFDVIGNNELDPKINAVYLKNHKPKYNFCCDIREMTDKELPKELFNIDILDGSPPCSVFSMAGLREKAWDKKKKFREGQKTQKLDDLFIHFLNFAEKIKPKIIVAENVKGLISGKSKGYVNEILKKFSEIGYKTQIFLLNSATMGVPQKRQRVFFIAYRNDLNFPKLQLKFNEKSIKYGEFKDKNYIPMNKETQTYKLWLQRRSSDRNLASILGRTEGRNSRFNSVFIKDDMVLPTVTSSGDSMRFDVPGFPSNKDFITAQTFPQDFNFCKQNVKYICGMSVPPLMMGKIAEQIYVQWLRGVV